MEFLGKWRGVDEGEGCAGFTGMVSVGNSAKVRRS